jgi:exodeoxyribonuclease III
MRSGTERDLVKVATFNINNINKRLANLLAWLAKAEPDVVSLQELKAEQEAFPVNALRSLGYEAVWQGERSWNGVAILARNQVPVLTRTSLPGNSADHQARYIEAAVQGVLITSIYLPNGNPHQCIRRAGKHRYVRCWRSDKKQGWNPRLWLCGVELTDTFCPSYDQNSVAMNHGLP